MRLAHRVRALDPSTDRCVTVSYGKVAGSAKQWEYQQSALYTISARKRDGRPTWRYRRHLGIARRSPRLAQRDCQEWADRYGCGVIDGVRHGRGVTVEGGWDRRAFSTASTPSGSWTGLLMRSIAFGAEDSRLQTAWGN